MADRRYTAADLNLGDDNELTKVTSKSAKPVVVVAPGRPALKRKVVSLDSTSPEARKVRSITSHPRPKLIEAIDGTKHAHPADAPQTMIEHYNWKYENGQNLPEFAFSPKYQQARAHFGRQAYQPPERDTQEAQTGVGWDGWGRVVQDFGESTQMAGGALATVGLLSSPIAPEIGLPAAVVGGVGAGAGTGIRMLGGWMRGDYEDAAAAGAGYIVDRMAPGGS